MSPAIRAMLLGAVLLASCTSYVEQRLEGLVLEALPRVIGPAERYEASVRGVSADGNRIDRVHAVGTRVQRPHAPLLERVEAELLEVHVDREARRVTAIGTARVTARVRADDLAAYFAQQQWIAAPSVRFLPPADIVVSGRLRIFGLPLPAASTAQLRGRLSAQGSQLWLTVGSLRYADLELPGLARALAEQALNPVFDAANHAVPSTIDSVAVDADAIVIRASGSRVAAGSGSL